MPNSTTIRETIACPFQEHHKSVNPDVILTASIGLYPQKYYKFNCLDKNINLTQWPKKLYFCGCNVCFSQLFEKFLTRETAAFIKAVEDKGKELEEFPVDGIKDFKPYSFISKVEYCCRNSETERYHKHDINKTGDCVIIGEVEATFVDFTRYHLLTNKPLRINIDLCNTCISKVIPEVDIIIKNRLIEKVINNPAFESHNPERTQAFLMGIFRAVQKEDQK